MPTPHIPIFATELDFGEMMARVEASMALRIAPAGVFETPRAADVSSWEEARRAGSPHGIFIACRSDRRLHVRAFQLKAGGTRYAVDLSVDPHAVSLKPSRAVGTTTLLSGQIGIISKDPEAMQLFELFSGVIRQDFVKIQSFRVGPQAVQLLDSGGRLASILEAPPEYDLRRAATP